MRGPILTLAFLYQLLGFGLLTAQQLELVGDHHFARIVHDLSIQEDYAYLIGGDLLYILDISDQENPSLTGTYRAASRIGDISVLGDYAYITLSGIDPYAGLHIIDISDPENPSFVGWYDLSYGYVYNLFVVDEYVYVNDHFSQFVIIDTSDPSNPTFVGYYSTLGTGEDVFVDRPYAYVADDGYGLHIMDVSDPANPTYVGENTNLIYACRVFVAGDYAYIGAIESGLRIADVSDPSDPEQISDYLLPANAGCVSVSGDFAFVTGGYIISIMVVYISDPYNPVHVLNYDTPGTTRALVVIDEYVYIAVDQSLQILRFDEELGAKPIDDGLPSEMDFPQNHPNPFNASTTISYSLPEQGNITMSIYNLLGQKVATIFEGTQEAGEHTTTWDARDFPSGVYFARLEAGDHSENIKMVLLK